MTEARGAAPPPTRAVGCTSAVSTTAADGMSAAVWKAATRRPPAHGRGLRSKSVVTSESGLFT